MPRKLSLVGGLAIIAVALATYYPAVRIGFVNNDWIYLDWVARLDWTQYFYHYLVPGAESGWYRPIFGIYFWVVYTIFGANQNAYHLSYIVLHGLNGLLVFFIVKRGAANLSIAAIASLLFVTFPAFSKAVYWPSTPDTLEMFFYLGAVWCWLTRLQLGGRRFEFLTFLSFVLALVTKESAMTLPVVLFLVDRMLVRRPATWQEIVRRYVPFVLVWIPYLIMEYALQRSGSYVSMAGYGFGVHMFWNLINSLAALIYPWQLDPAIHYAMVAIGCAALLAATLIRRSRALALLGILVFVNLIPVIGFPTEWFELRYLYSAAVVSSIIIATVFVWAAAKLQRNRWYVLLASGVIAAALLAGATSVADAASGWGEIARQRAVPFRDIELTHPTFPASTKVYFIDSKSTAVYDLSVMFLLHYGPSVLVDGTDDNQLNRIASLRETPVAYVYYFDATGKPIQVQVVQNAATASTAALPVSFSGLIQLSGYEIADNSVKPGAALVLFLYWSAQQKIDIDYTVFVHLVDKSGSIIAGYDSQPHGGQSPTSAWVPGQLNVDPIVLQIPTDATPGADYDLEVGIYAPTDGKRLAVIGADGRPVDDKVSIQSFRILE
jgi:hypothetical protein